MRYLDFVLQILPGPEGNPVVHVQSERGQGSAPFRLPFDAASWRRADLAEVIARGRNLLAQGEGRPGAHREVGEELFEALFSGEVLRLYERCLDRIESQPDLGLRIKLMIDPREPQVAPLQDLPWELMRQPGTPEFLTLSRRRLFVRYLAVPRPIEMVRRPQVLRVLCVAASPADLPSLALDRELSNLRDAIAGSEGIEIVELETPTLEGVRRALLEQKCHILHFMGHGDFAAAEGGGALWFEGPDGGGDPIRGEDLANKLADIPSLRLAVLNACDSGGTGGAGLFAGVASSLVLGGLPAVVAMQAPISDEAAIVFSQTFYRGILVGDPVDLAVAEARQAMHSIDPGRFEWATPVVLMRIPDGHLYFSEPTDTWIDLSSTKPGVQMAARKWYQNSKVAVPVLVALIGLAGTVVTVVIGKDGPGGKTETPIESSPSPQPAEPASKPAVLPDPVPVVSFPVIVMDDATGDHLAGAQVVADEQGVSKETDSQGRCTLTVRPGLGKLRVTISLQGYRTKNVELTVFKGMDAARFRLQRR
jgi:hypothetical protein